MYQRFFLFHIIFLKDEAAGTENVLAASYGYLQIHCSIWFDGYSTPTITGENKMDASL